jgi:hypothetical protein
VATVIAVIGCSSSEEPANTERAPSDETFATTDDIPSLQDKLDERRTQSAESMPPEIRLTFSEGLKEIAESQVMETALTVGDTAPNFSLPNAVGDTVHLSTLLQDGPVILTWYRGGW